MTFGCSVGKPLKSFFYTHIKMSFLHFFFPITRTNCYNISFTRCHPTDVITLIKLSHKINCIFWNFINTVCAIVSFFFGKNEFLIKEFYNFWGLEGKTFLTQFVAWLKPWTDENPGPLLGDGSLALFFSINYFL